MTDHEKIVDTATGETADAAVSSQRVLKIFNEVAEKYERFNAVSSFGAYKGWLRKTIAAAPLTHESNMLDLAGGTGDVSWEAARAKAPAHIQLTDLTPGMLEVAKRHVAEGKNCGVPVDIEVVDAQEIPYADNTFDVVTMAYGIRNIPDRMRALREVNRVLKPGGTFVCLEFSTPPNPVWGALYAAYRKIMIPFWGGVITGKREDFVYLSNSIAAFPKQEEYAEMLGEAGFKNVAWQNCTGGIAAIHTAMK